jgi:hypothetical protein
MKPTILYLVRFFDKEEYADQFMRGRLRLNRLRYYKKLEDAQGAGRGDYAEAPAAWWQKDTFSIEFHDHPELNIRPNNLAGPVLFSFDKYGDLNVLCFTAIHTGEFEVENGQIILEQGDEHKLRNQLRIDDHCLEMGRFAVVMLAGEFVHRAKGVIEALGYTYTSTLVDYFHQNSFHGRFDLSKMPFTKRSVFAYQREYRICVDTHTKGNDPVEIEIGGIGDFAAKMAAAAINTAFPLDIRTGVASRGQPIGLLDASGSPLPNPPMRGYLLSEMAPARKCRQLTGNVLFSRNPRPGRRR